MVEVCGVRGGGEAVRDLRCSQVICDVLELGGDLSFGVRGGGHEGCEACIGHFVEDYGAGVDNRGYAT